MIILPLDGVIIARDAEYVTDLGKQVDYWYSQLKAEMCI